MLDLLKTYFQNDFDGGNPFLHFGTKYVAHQTLPEGRGALAADFLITELANDSPDERRGLFFGPDCVVGETFYPVSQTQL